MELSILPVKFSMDSSLPIEYHSESRFSGMKNPLVLGGDSSLRS